MKSSTAPAHQPATAREPDYYGVYNGQPDSPQPFAIVAWHCEPGHAPRADEPTFAADFEAACAPFTADEFEASEPERGDPPNLLRVYRRRERSTP